MSKPRKLLFSVTADDCEWTYFTVGGHGGSGKDTSNTGARVVHPPSGAVGVARESRSQLGNRRRAFARMGQTQEFQSWARRRAAQHSGNLDSRDLDRCVDEWMNPQNLKIEYRTAEGWKTE